MDKKIEPSCPIPITDYPHILLAHGGGGKLMHQLLEKIILPSFDNPALNSRHDGAVLKMGQVRIAFTTDSYVVQPLFFPGGDIGSLAINGTVNDLAMCGAGPLYLSAGFILEEGFPMETLWRVVQSMKKAAQDAGVSLVTGDTKVVDRGKGDQIFINTAGIGLIKHDLNISPASVVPGDAIILSGDIGRHGMAIMSARENIGFESAIESDCAPLHEMVLKLLEEKIKIHCLRDLTRGGLAGGLVEIAETCNCRLEIDESRIKIREEVRSACELLGLDPFYVANEGRFIAFVPEADATRSIDILRQFDNGRESTVIGGVHESDAGLVVLKTIMGVGRIVDMMSGEQLPRIC